MRALGFRGCLALGLVTFAATAGATSPALAAVGPAPTVCNGLAPTANCYYVVGAVPFTLSSHFVHVGHVLTGTAHWTLPGQGNGEFPTVAAVTLSTSGPGLKLLRCHGPLHVSNSSSAYGGPNAFKLVTGSTTCRWRAIAATGWATSLGAGFAITGSNPYFSADYYAVTGKTALEGTILLKNDRKDNKIDLGVIGAKVHVTGPKGSGYNATTNSDGYWYVLLNGGGKYTVHPIIPAKYLRGTGKNPVSPKVHHVHVPLGGVGRADFTVKDNLRLTLTLDRTSVPATGGVGGSSGALAQQVVHVTLTATEHGAPVPYFPVRITVFGGKPYSLGALPVPARICGGATWPVISSYTGDINNDISQSTDASGKITFSIMVGTIPGAFTLDAIPFDVGSNTQTQAIDLTLTNPTVTLDVTSVGAGSLAGLSGGITALFTRDGSPLPGITLTQQLQAAAAAGTLGAVDVAPILGNGSATLAYPAGARFGFAPGAVLLNAQGVVIDPAQWVDPNIGENYYTAARKGLVAGYPTVAQWSMGGMISYPGGYGWNMGPAQTTPYTLYNGYYPGYSFGFGYPGTGGC